MHLVVGLIRFPQSSGTRSSLGAHQMDKVLLTEIMYCIAVMIHCGNFAPIGCFSCNSLLWGFSKGVFC